MSPEALAELNPVKAIIGVVALLGFMGMGLLLSSATGPSPEDMERLRLEKAQMNAMMAQEAALDDIGYHSLPAGYDVAGAIEQGYAGH